MSTPATTDTDTTTDALGTARRLADEVLLPRATDVDRGRRPLRDDLDAIADAGLYGLHAPADVGGLAADGDTAGRVVEALAGGSLAPTFTWIQHQGAVKRIVAAGGDIAATWLPGLAAGQVRSGVAVGGVRPGRQDPVVARLADDGWTLHGTIPWLTGVGHVDVVLVAAREEHADGNLVWLLVDTPSADDPGGPMVSTDPTVTLRRVDLVACDATNSAVVTLDGTSVQRDRLVARQDHADWLVADAAGLRTNGSLPLGVAARCAALAEDAGLTEEVDTVRERLDRAGPEELPASRAAAADLVWRAAQRLLVGTGGRGVARGADAQRLAREAALLQVFGSRPTIREAHLQLLSPAG